MKPPPFEYFDPETLEEAIALIGEHGDAGKILAGGQSLVPMLNLRLLRPNCLIDINRVAKLAFIEARDQEIAIGAGTRQRAIERSELVREKLPLLYEAMPFIAHFQIRNRGTIGGSLCHADPAAELPAVVNALGGKLSLESVRGERFLNADDFYTGYLSTALEPDEMLKEIRLPFQAPGMGWAFLEISRRHGDFALTAIAACVELDEAGDCRSARLFLAGVNDVPFRYPLAEEALVGTRITQSDIDSASQILITRLRPQSDLHASADYRKQAARVLAARALKKASARARARLKANL
jgi:CO/xanthine dehydrogenase FAD-binding subunit